MVAEHNQVVVVGCYHHLQEQRLLQQVWHIHMVESVVKVLQNIPPAAAAVDSPNKQPSAA